MSEIRIEIYSEITLGRMRSTTSGLLARVTQSPVDGLVGNMDPMDIKISRKNLLTLRSRPAKSNLVFLQEVGDKIWNSFGSNVRAAIQATLTTQAQNNEKTSIVIHVNSSALHQIPKGQLRPDEIPVELIYSANNGFYALNTATPVIRGLSAKADRGSESVYLPLRVLVVISTPDKDKPKSSEQKERDVIEKALHDMLANPASGLGGQIWIKWCTPATKARFSDALDQFKPHIVHFIGHGGFDAVGQGDAQQGYLCFQREDDVGYSDPMHANNLAVIIRNTNVRLVVMTACSSAQPRALDEDEQYDTFAFEGVAQQLVAGDYGLTAAIAMQFDIEENAAVAFTYALYKNLLDQNITLEEIVTRARQRITTQLDQGHPSWVCPVLFSRSKNGIMFEMKEPIDKMDPAQEIELARQEQIINTNRQIVEKHRIFSKTIPVEAKGPFDALRDIYFGLIAQAEAERSRIIGTSVRIGGQRVKRDSRIELPVSLYSNGVLNIERIELEVSHQQPIIRNVALTSAAAAPMDPTIGIHGDGSSSFGLRFLAPTGDAHQFPPGVHEIGKLAFNIDPVMPAGFIDLKLSNIGIFGEGKILGKRGSMDTLFVED